MTPDDLVVFAEGLAQVAAAGGGARALASHLAESLGTGVSVNDADGRRLTDVGTARNGAVIRLPLLAGEARFGEIVLHAKDTPNATRALRLTAAAIALELARESGGNPGRRRAFWERLLTGGYRDVAAARVDAVTRGIALAAQYVAIALEPPESAALAAETFASGEASVGLLERDGGTLIFVPAPREVDAANARTAATLLPKTLVKKHPGLSITGGVGSLESAADVGRSARMAYAALAIGRRIFGDGRVIPYDELGAYALLFEGADTSALVAFAAATLAPLRAYDEKHLTDLERTLRSYFACGQNVKTAAAELHVHRHTVFYRLRQIGEICGRSLDSPHDQLTFRMATAIDALHS
ncbi:MAG: helix-turn-helix domain-containing protein [Candidatus Eremiobacteraeota bacterium]|nr:helix-turn-helix domain-containing protein [Candidatus Eremiobacteraeota bacterium]